MDSSLSHRGWVGGLNAFYWYQIFALDSAVVEVQYNTIILLLHLILYETFTKYFHKHECSHFLTSLCENTHIFAQIFSSETKIVMFVCKLLEDFQFF